MRASISGAFSLQGLAQALTKLSRRAVGVVIGAAFTMAVLHAPQARAGKLDDTEKTGVLRVGVFDANPPFGHADAETGEPAELDVDYVQKTANKLGVKLELRATDLANRVSLLISDKVSIVTANFTITDERKEQIEFNAPYFTNGLQFIAKKGVLKQPDDLKGGGIHLGVDRGTAQKTALCEGYPNARIIAYNDSLLAPTVLRIGVIQAFTQGDTKLGALLTTLPSRSELEISPFVLTREYMGTGISKGGTKLAATINQTPQDLEKDGIAGRIYDRWFGPKSAALLSCDFIIGGTK